MLHHPKPLGLQTVGHGGGQQRRQTLRPVHKAEASAPLQHSFGGGKDILQRGGQLRAGVAPGALRHRSRMGREIGRIGHRQLKGSGGQRLPLPQVGAKGGKGQAVFRGVLRQHGAGVSVPFDARYLQ